MVVPEPFGLTLDSARVRSRYGELPAHASPNVGLVQWGLIMRRYFRVMRRHFRVVAARRQGLRLLRDRGLRQGLRGWSGLEPCSFQRGRSCASRLAVRHTGRSIFDHIQRHAGGNQYRCSDQKGQKRGANRCPDGLAGGAVPSVGYLARPTLHFGQGVFLDTHGEFPSPPSAVPAHATYRWDPGQGTRSVSVVPLESAGFRRKERRASVLGTRIGFRPKQVAQGSFRGREPCEGACHGQERGEILVWNRNRNRDVL